MIIFDAHSIYTEDELTEVLELEGRYLPLLKQATDYLNAEINKNGELRLTKEEFDNIIPGFKDVGSLGDRLDELKKKASIRYYEHFEGSEYKILKEIEQILEPVTLKDVEERFHITEEERKENGFYGSYYFDLAGILYYQIHAIMHYLDKGQMEQSAILTASDLIFDKIQKLFPGVDLKEEWEKEQELLSKKEKKKLGTGPINENELYAIERQDFLSIPATLTARVLRQSLFIGNEKETLGLFAKRNNTPSTKVETKITNENYRMTFETRNIKTAIEISNIFTNVRNITATKLWVIITSRGYSRCFDLHTKTMHHHEVTITAKELVEVFHIYTEEKNAIAGLKNFVETWNTVKPQIYASEKGENEDSKKVDRQACAPVSKFVGRDGGTLTFIFNDVLDGAWVEFFKYYTKLPVEAFSLSNRSFTLLVAILERARQNQKEILNTTKIKITLRYIQTELSIPDEKTTPNPKRDILKVLNTCVDEINKTFKDKLKLSIPTKGKESYAEYMDNGSLEVNFLNDYWDIYSSVAYKQEKILEDMAEKKLEKEAKKEAIITERTEAKKKKQ